MYQAEAFDFTLKLAYVRGMQTSVNVVAPELSYRHLIDMQNRVCAKDMSEQKLGRWLGWAQAAVVAAQCASLAEMKLINQRFVLTETNMRILDELERGVLTWGASVGACWKFLYAKGYVQKHFGDITVEGRNFCVAWRALCSELWPDE